MSSRSAKKTAYRRGSRANRCERWRSQRPGGSVPSVYHRGDRRAGQRTGDRGLMVWAWVRWVCKLGTGPSRATASGSLDAAGKPKSMWLRIIILMRSNSDDQGHAHVPSTVDPPFPWMRPLAAKYLCVRITSESAVRRSTGARSQTPSSLKCDLRCCAAYLESG